MMSITVINPNGVVVKYNYPDWIKWIHDDKNIMAKLYLGKPDTKEATFRAAVPPGCIVSFDHPDEVRHAGTPPPMTVDAAVGIVESAMPNIEGDRNGELLASMKSKLGQFDARKKEWIWGPT
jgi:hypothetical protein